MRSFEVARKIVNNEPVRYETDRCQTDAYEPAFEDTKLPLYKTRHSAGADFFCAKEVVIPSIWKSLLGMVKDGILHVTDREKVRKELEPTLVHTGVKASMEENECLVLCNRSSNPKKLGLILANGIGLIDKDYYNNVENDGEIMFAFYNFMPFDRVIHVGDTLGQGVFQKFLYPEKGLRIADEERKSGFGSTDK